MKIRIPQIITLIVFTLLPGQPGIHAQSQEEWSTPRQGTVQTNVLNVRANPGTAYEVVAKVQNGDRLTVVNRRDDWYEITPPPGTEAWCASRFLAANGEVTGDDVRLRSGPGVMFSEFGKLNRGEKIELIGHDRDGWQQVVPPDHATVWVNALFVHVPVPERKPQPQSFIGIAKAGSETTPSDDDDDDDAATTTAEPDADSTPDATPEAKEKTDATAEDDANAATEPLEATLEPVLEESEIPATNEQTDLETGVLIPLNAKNEAGVTHVLAIIRNDKKVAKAFLRSSRIDLAEWEYREVRVYGPVIRYAGWRMPVMIVTGIQLLNP